MRTTAIMLVLAAAANAAPFTGGIVFDRAPLYAIDVPGKTYRVKDGDTLARISKQRYGTTEYAGAIKAANKLPDDTLEPGMVLTLPSNPDEWAGAEAAAPAGAKAASTRDAKPAKTAKKAAKSNGSSLATIGDLLDVIANRILALCDLIGLKFQDGPLMGPKIAMAVFFAALLYIVSDMCIFWFGSMALRFNKPSISNAATVSFASTGMQILLVILGLSVLAVTTQAAPGVLSFDSVRALSLDSRVIQFGGILLWFGVFFFLPAYITSRVYSTTMKSASLIVFVTFILKNCIAFTQTANALLLTGGAQAS